MMPLLLLIAITIISFISVGILLAIMFAVGILPGFDKGDFWYLVKHGWPR